MHSKLWGDPTRKRFHQLLLLINSPARIVYLFILRIFFINVTRITVSYKPAVKIIFPGENSSKLGNGACPLSPRRLLYNGTHREAAGPRLMRRLSKGGSGELRARCLWKERLLFQHVCCADTVNHKTDGSSADYGILTFGIASNIFDKLASFYIWFSPQYKSHENSKLKIIKWAGNNQIPHIPSPPPQMTDFDMLKFHKGSKNIP